MQSLRIRSTLRRAALAAAVALIFAVPAAAAETPAAKPAADAPVARVDAEQARRDLQQMREQMREMSRKMAELSARLGDVGPRAYAYRYIGDPDRGVIGVVLGRKDKSGTRGLKVDAVTPGSPADKAGVKHGDVIVSVDGKPVVGKDGNETESPFEEMKVGQEVKLGIVRDGRNSEVTVKAERREPFNFSFAFGDNDMEPGDFGHALLPPDFEHRIHERVDRAMERAHIAEHAGEAARRAMDRAYFRTPWWGLNLASLNSDLGSYFGADRGVLVLSTDDEALKALKAGDVLQQIDGSKVDRPEDALRILRERAGSEVKVQVLRQRKPLTLSLKAPEFKGIFVPPPPVAPEPPEPPEPPVAPAPAPRAMPGARPAPAMPAPPPPPRPPAEDDRQV